MWVLSKGTDAGEMGWMFVEHEFTERESGTKHLT